MISNSDSKTDLKTDSKPKIKTFQFRDGLLVFDITTDGRYFVKARCVGMYRCKKGKEIFAFPTKPGRLVDLPWGIQNNRPIPQNELFKMAQTFDKACFEHTSRCRAPDVFNIRTGIDNAVVVIRNKLIDRTHACIDRYKNDVEGVLILGSFMIDHEAAKARKAKERAKRKEMSDRDKAKAAEKTVGNTMIDLEAGLRAAPWIGGK